MEGPQKLPEVIVMKLCSAFDLLSAGQNVMFVAPDDKLVPILAEAVGKVHPTENPIITTINLTGVWKEVYGYLHKDFIAGSVEKALASIDQKKAAWVVFNGVSEAEKLDALKPLLTGPRLFISPSLSIVKLMPSTKVILVSHSLEKLNPGFLSMSAIIKI